MATHGTYDFTYGSHTPYAHAVALVSRWRAEGGQVLVDLGCGYGAIAEPVRALGLDYLGIDLEPAGIEALTERGVEAIMGDLGAPEALFDQVSKALGRRRVAAFSMLDAVEHLPGADDVLSAIARHARLLGDVPLIVSIPNVSHQDLAAKLVLGRWDVTPTGLLDATHVRFFSPGGLELVMARAGWSELERHDFELEVSDQHFPPDCVALQPHTPVGALLRGIRQTAAPGAATNQFVRAYRPSAAPGARSRSDTGRSEAQGERAEPLFLSVVVRSDGSRPVTFDELVLSLAGQTCDDFEVVVVLTVTDPEVWARVSTSIGEHDPAFARRVRLIGCGPIPVRWAAPARAANAGVEVARGRYVAVLDDDQLAFGHWVSALAAGGTKAPGRVLHVGVASQQVVATPGRWQRSALDEPPATPVTAGQFAQPGAAFGIGGKRPTPGPAPGPESRIDVCDAYDVLGRPSCDESFEVGLLDLLTAPPATICGYAIPRSLFVDLGERFDEDLPALADWDLLLSAVERCGVDTTSIVGLMRRAWQGGQPAPAGETSDQLCARAEESIRARLNAAPLLLDRSDAGRLTSLLERAGSGSPGGASVSGATAHGENGREEAEALARAAADAEARLAAVYESTSWRMTAPLRAAVTWWRRR